MVGPRELVRIIYSQSESMPSKYVKVPETLINVMGELQERGYYGSLELKYENGKITHGRKTESLKF